VQFDQNKRCPELKRNLAVAVFLLAVESVGKTEGKKPEQRLPVGMVEEQIFAAGLSGAGVLFRFSRGK
jgi:hypothetical protein